MRLAISIVLSLSLMFACDEGAPTSEATPANGPGALGKGDRGSDVVPSDPTDPTDVLGTEDVATDPAGDSVDGPDVEVDPLKGYEEALDITVHHVTFPEGTPFPDSYDWPQGTNGFSMGGTEFWQKWTGGENPTFSFAAGSDFGRRCMYASARRWEAVMADPPADLVQVLNDSNWSSSNSNSGF